MRKSYKKKRRSCALCKPHKIGKAKRWTRRDEVLMREFEKVKRRGVVDG